MGVIQKIVASVFDANGNIDEAIYNEANLLSRQQFTPLQYGVILFENTLRLVKYDSGVVDEFGQQIVKTVSGNVTSSTNFTLDNTDGIEPGMIVSGLDFTGVGTITGNIHSNVITGVGTTFMSDLSVGTLLFYNNFDLGYVTNVASNTQVTVSGNLTGNISNVGYSYLQTITSGNTRVISTSGHSIVTSNIVTALSNAKIVFTATTHKYGAEEPWRDLINVYGNLTNGSSQVKLELTDGNEVVGTVAYNPIDDTVLLYSPDIDTLPVNTIAPVNAIIDPISSRPNKDLQNLVDSTRYLLVNDYYSAETGANASVYNWLGVDNTPLRAYANDIIQYDAGSGEWFVSFNSQNATSVEYVTNLTTNVQYRYTDGLWVKSYEGFYEAGDFSIVI